jgi:hypothetical protein
MLIARWGRFWAVYEGEERYTHLVCVSVYRKGAREVARRLANGRDVIEPRRTRRPNGPPQLYTI